MSKPVDVVAVLRQIANAAENYRDRGPIGEEYDSEELARLKSSAKTAIDAVAELIAADLEHDAAQAEYEKHFNADEDDDLILIAGRRLQWATDRRAAALAACKPATGESS